MTTQSQSREQVEDISEKLNKVIIVRTIRPNGTLREQQDFSNCVSLTDQSQAKETDINYLMQRFKPDELAAYIAARAAGKEEIIGHDFSQEPDLQSAKNVVYVSQQAFLALPEEIRNQFRNHVEFLKFIDNPANAEKMVKLGLLQRKQIEDLQSLEPIAKKEATPTTIVQEEKKEQK